MYFQELFWDWLISIVKVHNGPTIRRQEMGAKAEQTFIIVALSVLVFGIWSISSGTAYAKTPVDTTTPTKLNATAISPTQITLSWISPTQNYGKIIVGYKIEQMIGGGVFDVLVTNTGSTFPNYSVTGLKTGTTYTFRVSVLYSDDTTTDPSNWASATPTVKSVPPPVLPSTSQLSNEKLDFTPSDGTTLYGVVITQIDYQQLLDKKEPRSIISNNVQTSQPINDDLNGVLRYESGHQISPTVPAPLIAKAVSPTQIDLSWLQPEESYGQVVIGYKIEWKQAPGAYVIIEDNTHDISTKYSVTGLTTGTTYTYRVSAVFASDTISNPSNEASATPLASLQPIANNPETSPIPTNNVTYPPTQNTASNPLNVEFDFIPADGAALPGVVLTQSEYQQLLVIKDPRSIIANVTQSTNTINNDLSGLLKYQSLHTPQQGQQLPTSNYTQPPTTPGAGLNISLLYGIITSVVASGAVGIITWLVRTKVARKIAKEYNFTIEKFIDDGIHHIRIRNSGQTIENCVIRCDNKICFWKDTDIDKPRHVFEGSSSVAKLPEGLENANPIIIINSGKKILRKIKLDDMAHGSKIDESSDSI
jgi:hypothetical protein